MHEYDDNDPLEITDGPPPAPLAGEGHVRRIRGCPFDRQNKGHWWLLVEGVRWDFRVLPSRRLSRGGVEVDAPQVQCLDDAALFALGYHAGLFSRVPPEGGAS
jgi:hypothetical protein